MSGLYRDILRGIGNTPLLALRNVVPENGSRIDYGPTNGGKVRMNEVPCPMPSDSTRIDPP